MRVLKGHSDWIMGVAITSDGRYALTGSFDGTTRLWDLATGDEVVRLLSLNAEKDWLVVTPEGLFDGSEGGRQAVSFRVGNRLNVVPVDRFFQDFYRPGLLTDLSAACDRCPKPPLDGPDPPSFESSRLPQALRSQSTLLSRSKLSTREVASPGLPSFTTVPESCLQILVSM